MTRPIDALVNHIHSSTAQALVYDERAWNEKQKRLQEAAEPWKVAAIQMIQNTARTCPNFIKHCLTHPYRQRGYEVIGIGYSSTVIKIGSTAFKVLRATATMPKVEQMKFIQSATSRQSQLLEFVGEFAVEQDFSISLHPIKPSEVVVAEQPFVSNFSPLELTNSGRLECLDEERLNQLRKFAGQALKMFNATGFAPDVVGPSNIGFNNRGDLLLVDTLPPLKKHASISCARCLTDLITELDLNSQSNIPTSQNTAA